MEQKQDQNITKGAVRNANSRIIFKNPELCCQFLKDNFDIPLLKNIRPEDIEDVSEKYQAYLGIELESDSVKRIHLKPGEFNHENGMYVVSLIEHKSYVDYDVAMQLLKYMACIWDDYAREMEQKNPGITARKGFRYPPILPIVYYEGREKWTADLYLKDRIFLKEIFQDYLPDFTYHVVRIHDYTNEELLRRMDEMSLLMMLNKVQSPEDMEFFLGTSKAGIEEIIRRAPQNIVEIIASTIHSLCIKMDMSTERTAQCVEAVKERNMGYLFENMERLDIQIERKYDKKYREEYERKWEDAQKEFAKMRQEMEIAKQKMKREQQEMEKEQQEMKKEQREMERAQQEMEKEQREMERAQQEIEKERQEMRKEQQEIAEVAEKSIKNFIKAYQCVGFQKELALKKLEEEFFLSSSEAEEKVNRYWECPPSGEEVLKAD